MHCVGTPDSPGYQDYKSKQEHIKSTSENNSNQDNKRHTLPSKTKTVSQADAELRERLEQMSGEGGASGIEYEDGKPNAMKRGELQVSSEPDFLSFVSDSIDEDARDARVLLRLVLPN
ncbi:hypothetical protein PENFLA_c001G05706 [Penicillium flavigenum]|uniref:Uncharacterized protein n=1 Tax=Penicillium flavigenum TaxID=254877 RepID=A0A1V6U291_9EURO|nr:hypothetical protein PENFLA_c001G05706 [Penicillium flavigenum]